MKNEESNSLSAAQFFILHSSFFISLINNQILSRHVGRLLQSHDVQD